MSENLYLRPFYKSLNMMLEHENKTSSIPYVLCLTKDDLLSLDKKQPMNLVIPNSFTNQSLNLKDWLFEETQGCVLLEEYAKILSTSEQDNSNKIMKILPFTQFIETITISENVSLNNIKKQAFGSYLCYIDFFKYQGNNFLNKTSRLKEMYEHIYGLQAIPADNNKNPFYWAKNIPQIKDAVDAIKKASYFRILDMNIPVVNATSNIHEIMRQMLMRYKSAIVYYDNQHTKTRHLFVKCEPEKTRIISHYIGKFEKYEEYFNGVYGFEYPIENFSF